jgi:hypothetical protein
MAIEFETFSSLQQHCIRHVLTPEESYAWNCVWQEQYAFLHPTRAGDDQCYRLREAVWQMNESQAGSEAKMILDRYLAEIERQVSISKQLNWNCENQFTYIGLGINGVVSITSKSANGLTVKTAYLPGFGSSEAVERSKQETDNINARVTVKSRMRFGREPIDSLRRTDQRFSRQCNSDWTAQQKIYYLVFRPVMQFIRGYNHWSDRCDLSLADLKERLPRMSQLKFENWLSLQS